MIDTHPPPRSLIAGFHLPLEALGVLRRERSLWPLAVVPVLLTVLALFLTTGVLVAYAGELYGWATAWMPELQAARWFEWLWVGPARAGLAVVGAALFLAVAVACLVVAFLLASLLSSPVHDALSRRVEQIVTGGLLDASAPGIRGILREGGRAVREELRRLLFYLILAFPLVLAGAVFPGVQLLTGPALLAVTVFFLPLDYASYTLDRRHVDFPEKRRWFAAHRPVLVGFGLAALLTCAIPGLNLLAMPVLVVAGTLLAVRLPVEEKRPAGA